MTKLKDIKIERVVQGLPDVLYSAFTTSVGLHEWLCDVADVQPHEGGRIYLWWAGGYYSIGEIRTAKQPEQLAFTWHGRKEPGQSYVSVKFSPDGDRTTVSLRHTGLESSRVWKKTRKQLHQGWEKAFENLESVIENGIDQRRNRQADCGLYGLHPVSVTRSSKSHKVVQGLRIEGVDPNGPAASAGLAAGDILTRIGPIKTPSFALYLDALRRYRPGKTTSLTFIRDAQKKTVRIQFGQNPTFPIPATTSALAEAVQNTYFAFQDTLQGMLENTSESDCEFMPQEYAWSVNDILAHLIALEREVQNSIAAATEGQETGLFFGPPLKISRQAKKYSFPSTAALFDELKRSQLETVSLLNLLPVEFQERKGSYWRLATNLFETQLHMRAYIASLGRTLHAAQDLSVQ